MRIKHYLLIAFCCVFAIGCNEESVNFEQDNTEKIMQEVNASVGMPAITRFHEKRLAKMIFELRDQADLTTYAYIVAKNTGKLCYIGQCVGYGLPYSVQYTNPQRIVDADIEVKGRFSAGCDGFVIPQADPNGLYMPEGLSATWLMMLDKVSGEVKPVYVEPEIIVSPFPLH